MIQFGMKAPILIFLLCVLPLAGCEDVDLRQATEAGRDAIKAATLSERDVQQLSSEAAARLDRRHRIAPPGSEYARRLASLAREHRQEGDHRFEFKVYLSSQVNAFALGDGSIRVYSGLMDRMSDQELLFVIGHEIGHVVEEHVREKMAVALAGSALRKGLASQENIVGALARSALGDFVQRLVNAQFSQEEEEQADDYALEFMRREGYDPEGAVSALEKLGGLGKGHTFLSSHPAPEARSERLRAKLRGEDGEEGGESILDRILAWIWAAVDWAGEQLKKITGMLPGR
jgi:putative metalloprotease